MMLGGNALDVSVAKAAALNVVEPEVTFPFSLLLLDSLFGQ